MLTVFAEVAQAAAQQPVVSPELGWGMVAVNAIILIKSSISEVIGFFKNRDDKNHDLKLALLEQKHDALKDEHATCKDTTSRLEKKVQECEDDRSKLWEEVGSIKAELHLKDKVKKPTGGG